MATLSPMEAAEKQNHGLTNLATETAVFEALPLLQ
jgi:hypothetical protein